ncbi:MAG: AgmX/PglI C-terminal domain-containing protein, partial [Candidatus Latescibacteria bacterium]|nr:AgmX/PglI C-terminal domain-containing protein [Candidatus Latescibacterota bacterium]
GTSRAQQISQPKPLAKFASAVQSSAVIQKVVRRHKRSFMSFYQHQLKIHPGLRGTIKLRLTVKEDGHVRKIEIVADSVKNRPLAAYITKRAEAWDFGKLDHGQVVDLTFPFAPV